MKKIFILACLLLLNVFVCSGEIKTVTLTLGGDAVGWYQDYKYSLTEYYPLTMEFDGCNPDSMNIMLNEGFPIAERVFLRPSGTQDVCLEPQLEKGGEYYITHCFGPHLESQITGAHYCVKSYDCSAGTITIQASVNENCMCTPSCSGKECGGDGCGGSCGSCGSGYSCSNGDCISETYCGDGVCNSGESCSSCPSDCGSCCTSHYQKGCYGSNVYWYNSCGNREGVYEYCGSGEICSGGQCIVTCTPSCIGNSCGSDGCGGSCGSCGSGYTCSSGQCVSSCSNECSYSGQETCYGTNGYKTCGDYDSDSCLEWSGVSYCSTGYECSGGSCVARQSSQSTSGQGASSQSSSSGGTYSQSSYQEDEKDVYYFLWFFAGILLVGYFIWKFKKRKSEKKTEVVPSTPPQHDIWRTVNVDKKRGNRPDIKKVKKNPSTKKKISKDGIRSVD